VLTKFWEAIGGKLAERLAAVSGPALVFWLGGLLAWADHRGGLSHLSILTGWLDRQSAATQIAVIIAVLLAVAGSGLIVDRLTTPTLRLLEGYWPSWMDGVRRRLIDRIQTRAKDEDDEWQRLGSVVLGPDANVATAEQVAAFVRLDQRQRHRPSKPNRYMPTRIGNILRAAETWPNDKYGLDAVVIWPRLWLVLPEAPARELVAARAALDSAVAGVIWGLLFCVFGIWTLIAVPVGLLVAICSLMFWVPNRAEVFGDLVEGTFDLHRMAVYEQLRWPLPINPHQEHAHGQRLTSYLWRGSYDPDPTFSVVDRPSS
jgi:hypothetical protein